ncbi:hypothetical protein BUALT_Bualt15G0043000 [Buddleja alternifolia]|uniref:Uncharacterized protein n=1 Tax=Buddleja alternifolia TaxID=168488 RepID=A0AAV6WCL2_9LAMI|nr:hypothetical protein BUALT_Bualt15G0043000 [Buddleja alternifolia]
MSAKTHKLHIYFLPMIDIARQFAKHGAKSTIITTPFNATHISKTIERDRNEHGRDISISLIKFPSREVGLPEDCENLSYTTTTEMSLNFVKALDLLQEPVEKLLLEGHADCIVAGAFFWWASDVAHKLNIPRLNFYGTGFFPSGVYENLEEHTPHEMVVSESEEFVVPGLPDVLRALRRRRFALFIGFDPNIMFRILLLTLPQFLTSKSFNK